VDANGPWSVVIADAQSGVALDTVPASAGSWQRGRVTPQTHSFPLHSLGYSRAQAHDLFGKDRPRDRVLWHCYRGTPVYGGLIIDSDYNRDTGMLDVVHNDVRELAAFRYLYGIAGYFPSLRYHWTGLSWRGMASRVARLIFVFPHSSAWPLPITVPSDEAGSEEMDIWGWQFRHGESLLKEIEEMPNGPDLDFHPRLSGTEYGWDMRIGNPFLTGPTFEVALHAIEQPLTGVKVKTIGEKITGVFGIGEGSEQDMKVGQVALDVSVGLSRDTKLTVKSGNQGVVERRATGFLMSRATTSQQWSFSVNTIDADPKNGIDPRSLRLGSIVRVESQDDPWIDDGWTEHRVLGFSGSLASPNKLDLTLETI
jgi:hypothetical protein